MLAISIFMKPWTIGTVSFRLATIVDSENYVYAASWIVY